MRQLLLRTGAAACALAACAAFGVANAGSPPTLSGISYVMPVQSYVVPVQRADSGGLDFWHNDSLDGALGPDDGPESFLHQPHSAGADEVRELQRAFPSTNWPPSMRY